MSTRRDVRHSGAGKYIPEFIKHFYILICSLLFQKKNVVVVEENNFIGYYCNRFQ